MVNLLGSAARGRRRVDLDAALSPDRHAALAERLPVVKRWWSTLDPRRSPADRARTPSLEPRLEEESSLAALEAAIAELAAGRARLLAASATRPRSAPSGLPDGRLLVCEIDMSIGGGEAEAASRSFFDVDDRPPWDLWLVAWGRTRRTRPDEPIACLLAFVPAEWEAIAGAGIEACPTGGLYWAD